MGYIKIDKPSHCLDCKLKNHESDNCILQFDHDEMGAYDTWEEQMANCPIKETQDIKFKAKRKDNGEWITGHYVYMGDLVHVGGYEIPPLQRHYIVTNETLLGNFYEIDYSTLEISEETI